jgi:hypothetical protein
MGTSIWPPAVEALVVSPEFAHLFDADELAVARQRLTDFGYDSAA